jgi:large subunit ribosomal protein L32
MAHEPKKRHSRQRQGKRRASINFTLPHSVICTNCGSRAVPHNACVNCGYYKGKQVIKAKQQASS